MSRRACTLLLRLARAHSAAALRIPTDCSRPRSLAAYSKPLMLSAIDFTSDESDAFIGWGFMPRSVKDLLYPKGYKGGFYKSK